MLEPRRGRGPGRIDAHRICVQWKDVRALEHSQRILMTCMEPGCDKVKLR